MALNTGLNFKDLWNEIYRTPKSPTERFFNKYSEEVEFEAVAEGPNHENALDDMNVESLDYDTMGFHAYISILLKTHGKETIDITPDMDQRSDDMESESHSDNYRNPISEPESKEEEWIPLKNQYNKILINRKV